MDKQYFHYFEYTSFATLFLINSTENPVMFIVANYTQTDVMSLKIL